jgi:hypothetical protein
MTNAETVAQVARRGRIYVLPVALCSAGPQLSLLRREDVETERTTATGAIA